MNVRLASQATVMSLPQSEGTQTLAQFVALLDQNDEARLQALRELGI